MPFDVEGARKAGASDDQIIAHLTQTRGFDVDGAMKAGASKPQIIDHLAQMEPAAGRSVGGFIENVGSSAKKLVTDTAHTLMNPVETGHALGSVIAGGAEKLMAGGQPHEESAHEKAADAIGKFYKDRYGSADAVKKTMYEDPVGFLSDLSVVLGGGEGALKGAAAVSKSAKLADAAAVAGKAAELTNPVALAGKTITGVAGAADALRAPAAEALYRTSISPKINTARDQVRAMVQTGLENKLPVTEAGAQRLQTLVQQLEDAKSAVIDGAARRGVAVDPGQVAARLQDTEKKFGLQVNPEKALSDIDKSGDEFLRTQGGATKGAPPQTIAGQNGQPLVGPNGSPILTAGTPASPSQPIPADLAQKLKTGTYQQLQGDYDKLRTAQVESQKALARGLKEELENAIPELKGLNEKQAKLLDLQPVLENAVNKAANRKSSGLGEAVAGIAGTTITGSPGGGAAAFLLHQVARDPSVRSRLGIAINHAQINNPAKFGSPSLKAAFAAADGYLNGLSAVGRSTSPIEAGSVAPQQ